MEQHSDESLMHRFQRRRQSADLEPLLDRYSARALAVARQVLFDHSLAEDAVQEAFVKMVRSGHDYDPNRPFSTWFYTILRNVCVDMLRRRRREVRAMRALAQEADLAVSPPTHEDPGAANQLLADLPAAVRRAVVLRVIEDLPFRDVAAALGITEEAAKKRVQRALRALRQPATAYLAQAR